MLHAAVVLALALAGAARGDTKVDYARHDSVPVVANKVGPYTNPSETYQYYSLPFCAPEDPEYQSHNIGEHLSGDHKVLTHYDIRFRVNEEWRELCEKHLTQAEVRRLADAIEEYYFFEIFVDGLPNWGYVGVPDDSAEPLVAGASGLSAGPLLFTHLHFSIAYNGDAVVGVNISTDAEAGVKLRPDDPAGQKVQFVYSVSWHPSSAPWDSRMAVNDANHALPTPLEVHWLSIINSLILVVLLTLCVGLILLRIVNHDFALAATADLEAGEAAIDDDIGWKLVHGDVFRTPSNLSLLTALVGAGAHLFATTAILLLAVVSGAVHAARRGSVLSSAILIYTFTAAVGGFVSARLYRKLDTSRAKDHSWAWNILLAVLFFPAVIGSVFVYVNSTAFAVGSTQAVPFVTILIVFASFALIGVPIGVVGGAVGRRTLPYKPPSRPNARPRAIPPTPLWRSLPVQLTLAGFLPFSAISIELHFIFSAVWGHKVYTVFGILSLAFALLTVVCAMIVVGLVYFQLAAEDYRWWWRSFASGGMVGVFLFAYAVFFYHGHTDMTGLLQGSVFFAYMGAVGAAFFLMFGAVGFSAAFAFVHYIYAFARSE